MAMCAQLVRLFEYCCGGDRHHLAEGDAPPEAYVREQLAADLKLRALRASGVPRESSCREHSINSPRSRPAESQLQRRSGGSRGSGGSGTLACDAPGPLCISAPQSPRRSEASSSFRSSASKSRGRVKWHKASIDTSPEASGNAPPALPSGGELTASSSVTSDVESRLQAVEQSVERVRADGEARHAQLESLLTKILSQLETPRDEHQLAPRHTS